MAIEIVPTSTTETNYAQRVSLDGRDFILTFQFNFREWRWYLDLADQDGLEIVSGVKLQANEDVLRIVVDERAPPGALVVQHLPSQADPPIEPRDPGAEQLGELIKLIYIEEETIAELLAEVA